MMNHLATVGPLAVAVAVSSSWEDYFNGVLNCGYQVSAGITVIPVIVVITVITTIMACPRLTDSFVFAAQHWSEPRSSAGWIWCGLLPWRLLARQVRKIELN